MKEVNFVKALIPLNEALKKVQVCCVFIIVCNYSTLPGYTARCNFREKAKWTIKFL